MTTKFILEVGVDTPTGREYVLEISLFDTLLGAVNVAESIRGWSANIVHNALPNAWDTGATGTVPALPIAGCTLCMYSDEEGTFAEYDLY